jgi:hypothetical protein
MSAVAVLRGLHAIATRGRWRDSCWCGVVLMRLAAGGAPKSPSREHSLGQGCKDQQP